MNLCFNNQASVAAKRIKYWRGETNGGKAKDVEKVANIQNEEIR